MSFSQQSKLNVYAMTRHSAKLQATRLRVVVVSCALHLEATLTHEQLLAQLVERK